MKKWITMVLVLCMALSLLAGCKKKDEPLTSEKAKQIVLEELGMSESQAKPHVHTGEHEGRACYCVYVTVDGTNMEYKVDGKTGEILAISKSGHTH